MAGAGDGGDALRRRHSAAGGPAGAAARAWRRCACRAIRCNGCAAWRSASRRSACSSRCGSCRWPRRPRSSSPSRSSPRCWRWCSSASGRGLRPGWRRWSRSPACSWCCGPNFETAGWGVLLPLLSATGMAVTIIANRKVTGRASVLAMQYYMSVTAMIFLLVATTAAHFSGLENFRDALAGLERGRALRVHRHDRHAGAVADLHGHGEGRGGHGGADDLRPAADGDRARRWSSSATGPT